MPRTECRILRKERGPSGKKLAVCLQKKRWLRRSLLSKSWAKTPERRRIAQRAITVGKNKKKKKNDREIRR